MKQNIHYAGIQASYIMMYAGVGAFCSLYLLRCGFSSVEIGIILTVSSILSILVQPVIASFADKNRNASLTGILLSISSVMAILCIPLFFIDSHSILTAVIYTVTLTVNSLMQPIVNSMSSRMAANDINVDFGLCRGFGSLGYSLATLSEEPLERLLGNSSIPAITILSFVMLAVSIIFFPKNYLKAETPKIVIMLWTMAVLLVPI